MDVPQQRPPQCPAPHPQGSSSTAEVPWGGRGRWGGLKGSIGRESGGPCAQPGVEKKREAQGRGQSGGAPGLPCTPCSRPRLSAEVLTGPLEDPHASGTACPPPLCLIHFLGTPAPPLFRCSPPSARYSVGPTLLSSWPHGACHPLSSARSQVPAGAGLTPTHLGVTTWGAGQCGGPGGRGSSPSVPRRPPPPGSAPACGCGAGRR